jgi:hypothetical protein
MPEASGFDGEWTVGRYLETAVRVAEDLETYGPRTVVLFGSVARLAAGAPAERPPRDLDLFLVGDIPPVTVAACEYGLPVELHRLRLQECLDIARCLRYDSRPIALSKLYTHQLISGAAVRVIAACLLLGPGYRAFGIQQIEVDGREDPRDYAVQRVLRGKPWWRRLQRYAAQRRGPWLRFSDKLVERDEFGDRS